MKKFTIFLYIAALLLPFTAMSQAQTEDSDSDTTSVTDSLQTKSFYATSCKNDTVSLLLKKLLLKNGVKLDTTQKATFNGQTIITSNQIATFINKDTIAPAIPIKKGIVITTCDASAYPLGNGDVASPESNGDSICSTMYNDYKNYCNENSWNNVGSFNDVGYLDFWIIPDSNTIAFNYCFGSAEYPNFSCDKYIDYFGIYIDGPYNEDRSYDSVNAYNNINIAMVPSTSETDKPGSGTRVTLNTINNGKSSGKCKQYEKNNIYFIDNSDKEDSNTVFGGFTIKLTTDVVPVIPGKNYHVQIAIANCMDHAMQSGLLLEALYGGKFNDTITYSSDTTSTNDTLSQECDMDLTLCENELLQNAGLTNILPIGLTVDTTITIQACNETKKIHLQINPSYNTIITDSIEADGKYIFNGKELTEPGTYIDTLQSSYGCDSLVVLVLAPAGVGLEEISQQNGLYVYPNPAKSEVTVKCTDAKDGESINFIDIQGRVVKRIDVNSISNGMTINIKDLENGFYYIRIGNKISKLIVK